jgi:invasion protein IalB
MRTARLFVAGGLRIAAGMRANPLLLLSLCLLAVPAFAQSKAKQPAASHPPAATAARPASGPKAIGKFDDWTAATNMESGQTVCYAFTRASASTPAMSGRGDVVLTVTERPSLRDAVAVCAGFAYAAKASATATGEQTTLDFYTAQRSAFARDGHAAVAAFQKGRQVVVHSPGPKNAQVADTFSLRGFSAAYAAITKACPAK